MLPKAYACYNKNKTILNKSSSGGVFYALASSIIKEYKGVVYGCVIVNGDVFHTRTDSIDGLLPMLGSKYVRSELRNTFAQCKEDLEKGRYVLYSGTPCQINALHFYLDRLNVNKDKLIGVDVICHGTPKPYYWKKYLELNFKNKDISDISFRYKVTKWDWETLTTTTTTTTTNIKIGDYISSFSDDPYIKAFLENRTLFDSCYKCQTKGENRKADITLGDFWGIDEIDPRLKNKKGTSLIIIRSNENLLLDILKGKCTVKEVPYLPSVYINNSPYYDSVLKKQNHQNDEIDLLISYDKQCIKIKNNKTIKQKIISYIFKHEKKPIYLYYRKRKKNKNNKVGIITECGYDNYGNRLQNYALLSTLKENGYKCSNIVYQKTDYKFIHYLYNFIKRKKDKIWFGIKQGIYNVSKQYEGKSFYFSKTKRKQKQLCKYKTIIVGSDQIWNASYHRYCDDLEFSLGHFNILNPPFKLISYAPSICMDSLTNSLEFLFETSLKYFDFISVREKQSKDLLKNIGIDSVVVLDPTLLLTKSDWDKAIEKYSINAIPDKEYQFTYVFENNNLDDILDSSYSFVVDCMNQNNSFFDSNQFDFINLIKHSSLVVTNSFHVLVFSIVYGKKVVIKKRKYDGMVSRLEELLSLVNLRLEYNYEYDFSNVSMDKMNKAIELSRKYLLENL